MFVDLKKLSVDELVGRLRAAEERFDDNVEQITDKAGRLLLVEEDWLEKHKHRFHSGNKQSEGNSGAGSSKDGGGTFRWWRHRVGQTDQRGHAKEKGAVP